MCVLEVGWGGYDERRPFTVYLPTPYPPGLDPTDVPVGMMKYSWKASLLPAWLPPLITLKHGTGMVMALFSLPASEA